MNQILYIFFGWVLGMLSTFIFRWTEKKYKIKDFRTGLMTEFKEVLPILAEVRFLIQSALGEFDRETLIWLRDMISIGKKHLLDPQMVQVLEELINKPEHVLQIISKLRMEDSTKGKGLKKYHLPFLDTNINTVPLLDIEVQGAIFKIRRYFDLLGQEIDMYNFYYQKTFDPASMDVNQEILKGNQTQCYRAISKVCLMAGNEIVNLIKKIEGKD